MTELLVGTKKGLFALEGEPGSPFEVAARAFAGEPVEYAMRDPRTGRVIASVTSPFYGPKLWVVLFVSHDGGSSWELHRPFWEQPTRPDWQPGGGGLCLHSIVPWPDDPDRLALAISAAGVWLSDDGGETWRHGNKGLRGDYLPEDAPEDTITLCIHDLQRAPLRPERLFMQFHGGVYRSDDAGESWIDIAEGLPSNFGFPLVVDPADPDSAYVIPLTGSEDRVTPEGRPRVWETRDAGATWTERGDGLPAEHAYLTVLRQAFDRAGSGDALELYFGTTTGEVFGSGDAGATWGPTAAHLPPVYSVRTTAAT